MITISEVELRAIPLAFCSINILQQEKLPLQ